MCIHCSHFLRRTIRRFYVLLITVFTCCSSQILRAIAAQVALRIQAEDGIRGEAVGGFQNRGSTTPNLRMPPVEQDPVGLNGWLTGFVGQRQSGLFRGLLVGCWG